MFLWYYNHPAILKIESMRECIGWRHYSFGAFD